MSRSKASAYRAGQRRALKDMRAYIDQMREAVNALQSVAGADPVRVGAMREVLSRVNSWAWDLERKADNG